MCIYKLVYIYIYIHTCNVCVFYVVHVFCGCGVVVRPLCGLCDWQWLANSLVCRWDVAVTKEALHILDPWLYGTPGCVWCGVRDNSRIAH